MCISRPAGTLGVLTPQEMAHCIRKVRAAADETYTEARQRARRFVSSSATKSMQGGYSSESSVDADWRGHIDMWKPSARLVELAGQFPASFWRMFRCSWRSECHEAGRASGDGANFIEGGDEGRFDSSDDGGRGGPRRTRKASQPSTLPPGREFREPHRDRNPVTPSAKLAPRPSTGILYNPLP